MTNGGVQNINPLLLVPDEQVLLKVVDTKAADPAQVGVYGEGDHKRYEITLFEGSIRDLHEKSWLASKGVTYDQLKMATAIHEVAHIRYKSFEIDRTNFNYLQLWVSNLLEDNRIEYHLSHDNPSMAIYLRILMVALKSHLDSTNAQVQEDQILLQKFIARRTLELFYITRFGIVLDTMNEDFVNFCLPLVLSATRGGHRNCERTSLTITAYIELMANDFASKLKKYNTDEKKEMIEKIDHPEVEEDEDEEDLETPSGTDDEDDEAPINDEDEETQDEPGESEDKDVDRSRDVLPPAPEDQLNEDDEMTDEIEDMEDFDPAAFARAINSMTEKNELSEEEELTDLIDAAGDEAAMPSNVKELLDNMKQQMGSSGGSQGSFKAPFSDDAELEVETKEHTFYRETVTNNLPQISRLRKAIHHLFKTTKVEQMFDGDINPLRQQQAYLNSRVGESGRDYLTIKHGQDGLDVVVLRDVSGSTSWVKDRYAEALVSILAALDGVKEVRTAAIDFSTGATELKNFDQTVEEGKIYPRVQSATYITKAIGIVKTYKFVAKNKMIIVITDGGISDLHAPDNKEFIEQFKKDGGMIIGYNITTMPNRNKLENTLNSLLPMADSTLEELPEEIIRMVSKKLRNFA